MADVIKRILVGFDGSEPSAEAMRYACRLATGLGADLVVVTVKHLPQHVAGYFDDNMKARMDEHYQQIADMAVGQCGECGVCSKARVIEGHPAEAMAEYARENDIDLIVVGSRGLRGLTKLFVGSTAEALIQLAPCPVLVYKKK